MTFTEHRADATPTSAVTTGWYRRGGKRLFDLVIVIPLVALAVPILVAVTLALRIRLGAGIVLRQERIGLHGRPFGMYKLRTMEHSRRVPEPASWNGPDRRSTHKSPADPRHTSLGRLVRKFSLDEVPQLLNVVRGEMSLVGPRPQLADLASMSFRAHSRHDVRPGLTGPFQLSPLRSEGDLDAGLDLDATYVDDVTLRNDLKLLFGTLFALVRGTGA